jgi:hypothetical protein
MSYVNLIAAVCFAAFLAYKYAKFCEYDERLEQLSKKYDDTFDDLKKSKEEIKIASFDD